MNILLDTNILRQDFSLKSNKFEALFAYLSKTDSKLLLPDVVLREAENLFKRELQSHVSKIQIEADKLAKIAFLETTKITYACDMEAEALRFHELLLSPRKFHKTSVLPHEPQYLDETINRLIQAKKPASPAGKEFRDIIIWLTIKDYLSTHDATSIAFISANTREFASDAGSGLAAELVEEISALRSHLFFYSSIEGFLKDKASRVDFVTHGWLEEAISDGDIEDLALPELRSRDSRFESYAKSKEDSFSGYISVQSISPTLDEFFVYDMHDDGLYLNLSYGAEVEIEVGIEESDPAFEEGLYRHRRRSFVDSLQSTKTLYPDVYLSISARILDDKVVDLELDDWGLA